MFHHKVTEIVFIKLLAVFHYYKLLVCFQGRFSIAAKHHVTIAEIYESNIMNIDMVKKCVHFVVIIMGLSYLTLRFCRKKMSNNFNGLSSRPFATNNY